MSNNLSNAFRLILSMQSESATLTRRGEIAAVTIRISPSNYFRNLIAVEEIASIGNEFVIDISFLIGNDFEDGLRRGDIINSSKYGSMAIEEVRPMIVMGGLVGYRVRTNK